MPYVKDARIGGADHLHVATHVLPVQHHVLASPAYYILVEAAHFQEVGPVTATARTRRCENTISLLCAFLFAFFRTNRRYYYTGTVAD